MNQTTSTVSLHKTILWIMKEPTKDWHHQDSKELLLPLVGHPSEKTILLFEIVSYFQITSPSLKCKHNEYIFKVVRLLSLY